MTHEELQKHVHSVFTLIDNMLINKAADYAGSEDRMGNFKRRAAAAGVTPVQVCFLDLSKHYDAISNIMRGATNQGIPTQSLTDRLLDQIVYSLLLWGLYEEATGPNALVSAGDCGFGKPIVRPGR
jgi:hypothetical protein